LGTLQLFAHLLGRQKSHILMVVGVVSQSMPLLHYAPDELRVLCGLFAIYEEGGLEVILLQSVEYGGRDLGVRSIIES
jgi:hypothetical protein